MSINHILTSDQLIDVNCKSVSIAGTKVGMSSVNVSNATYASLDLTGVGTVFLDTGSGTTISGVSGTADGQMVVFQSCQQASSLTIENGTNIRTPFGTDIVLNGLGGVAMGVYSDALGYMTIVKTSV
jgi:hypothetical protein